MIARLLILGLMVCGPLAADAEQDVTSVVSTLASALSANNPEQFLQKLDHEMPDYRKLEHDLMALSSDTLISCSIEVLSTQGSETAQQAELDWYMVVRSQQDENLIERRRTKVTIQIEKRGKKWLVTRFSPVSVFSALNAK
jgi:hypothetical protein